MCPSCGGETWGDRPICAHHLDVDLLECANNRVMCSFIHRGVEPPRLSVSDREPMSDVAFEVETPQEMVDF